MQVRLKLSISCSNTMWNLILLTINLKSSSHKEMNQFIFIYWSATLVHVGPPSFNTPVKPICTTVCPFPYSSNFWNKQLANLL